MARSDDTASTLKRKVELATILGTVQATYTNFRYLRSIWRKNTEEEALSAANSTNYGLACSVWTENLTKAHRVAAKMKSGIVWINCWLLRDLRTPFGGMKQSGVGREGGWEALRFFTEAKNVCVKL